MNHKKERIRDVEKKLEEQYKLLSEYEEIRDYTSDPKEKRRALKEIFNTKENIKYYEQDLAKVRPAYKVGDLLRDALRRLNYSKQKEFIRRYLNTYRQKFGSFLIQGQLKLWADVAGTPIIKPIWNKSPSHLNILVFIFNFRHIEYIVNDGIEMAE